MPEPTTGPFAQIINKKEVINMLKKYQQVYDNYVKTNPSPQNAHEVRYILDQIENSSQIQFVSGYLAGWFIVNPKTLQALDLDDYYARTHPNDILTANGYDELVDKAEQNPDKYFKLANRAKLTDNLINLF